MKSNLHDRFATNGRIARANRREFDAAGVKAISVVGPAGSGKTTALESLLRRIDPRVRTAVMVGNLAAERQISRITRHGFQAIPLVTDNLSAAYLRDAIRQVDLASLDLLLIETDGNALSPVEFDLGHHLRVSVFSVAGGDDKATEYPFLVADSDLILLTKTDLLPFVTFDLEVFRQDVSRLKPGLQIVQGTTQTQTGMDVWVAWVQSQLPEEIDRRPKLASTGPFVNWPDDGLRGGAP